MLSITQIVHMLNIYSAVSFRSQTVASSFRLMAKETRQEAKVFLLRSTDPCDEFSWSVMRGCDGGRLLAPGHTVLHVGPAEVLVQPMKWQLLDLSKIKGGSIICF